VAPIATAERSILITAFEPYGSWETNASQLVLETLEKCPTGLPAGVRLIFRLYPVDFRATREALLMDLAQSPSATIHLGQAPDRWTIDLECLAINVGTEPGKSPAPFPLEPAGPLAYQSAFRLADWAAGLTSAGVAARLSYHAGTYLCNAIYYWACHWAALSGRPARSLFVHLPLLTADTGAPAENVGPHMDLRTAVTAINKILGMIARSL
jgi:pyroglutamyl-peptidase